MKRTLLLILGILTAIACCYAQKSVRYDLFVKDSTILVDGKEKQVIAINGQLPAPALTFTEGDTAVIYVHNLMAVETSVHWHGLILPNEMDGVPYLTTEPVQPGTTQLYTFPIVQHGTYWYHSHTMLQEQTGMYGAFVIYPKEGMDMEDLPLVISDWSNENPHQIERSLHNATDWYAINKNATQSYGEAVAAGKAGVKFINEKKRMMAMDVSDVYYDRVWINGKTEINYPEYKPGTRLRLRVINGSASTYFWLNYTGGKITVVGTDGTDVVPVEVDRLIVGVSETYDVVITIPEDGMALFSATSEDRTRTSSVYFGTGSHKPEYSMPRLSYFEGMDMMNDMMNLDGSMNDMGMTMSLQKMDMNAVMYPELMNDVPPVTLNYSMLRSTDVTSFPEGETQEINLTLTGNMNRYVWTLDNKTLSEAELIQIKKGRKIRVIMTNNSMMRHPMHLHGHFFRLVNGQGDYSPLKTVVDIMPMETDTLEFLASEEYGDWYFHCHILYHMMSGMGRVFTYETDPGTYRGTDDKLSLKMVYHDDRRFFPGAEIGLESNGSDGTVRYGNTRWLAEVEWRIGFRPEAGYETESHFGRYLGKNQFLMPYAGWDLRSRTEADHSENLFGQSNTKNERDVFCLGVVYTLPWFITTDWRVDHTGRFRLQLGRDDLPVTKRIRLYAVANTDLEYSVGMRHILTKYVSLSAHYDSDMKWGAGLTLTY